MRWRLFCVSVAALAAGNSIAWSAETTTYVYDELGRLIAVNNSGGPRNGKSALTEYDPAGNRASQAVGVPSPSPSNSAIFSISGPSSAVNEGQSATFTVTKTGTASGTLSVNYATVNGTALAPGDFAATSGTLTFRNWETTQTISVLTLDDGIAEGAETFSVSLSAPSTGASIGTASASASIGASGSANQPPITAPDSVSVKVCLSTTKNVVANDSDPEGGPLTLLSVGSSSIADLQVASSSDVGVSAYGTPGSEVVSYTVRDAQGLTSTGSLTVTVTSGTGCSRAI